MSLHQTRSRDGAVTLLEEEGQGKEVSRTAALSPRHKKERIGGGVLQREQRVYLPASEPEVPLLIMRIKEERGDFGELSTAYQGKQKGLEGNGTNKKRM